MDNIINKIMSKIPQEWKVISREDYALNKVYVSDAYQIIAAYDVLGELLVINHYPEIENFIEAYDEQIEEIKEVIKKKDWKEISAINPIKNEFLKNNKDEKLYINIFETYNNEEKISVQVFYQDKKHTIGITTFVLKDEKIGAWESVKKHSTINQILNLFVTKSAK